MWKKKSKQAKSDQKTNKKKNVFLSVLVFDAAISSLAAPLNDME